MRHVMFIAFLILSLLTLNAVSVLHVDALELAHCEEAQLVTHDSGHPAQHADCDCCACGHHHIQAFAVSGKTPPDVTAFPVLHDRVAAIGLSHRHYPPSRPPRASA